MAITRPDKGTAQKTNENLLEVNQEKIDELFTYILHPDHKPILEKIMVDLYSGYTSLISWLIGSKDRYSDITELTKDVKEKPSKDLIPSFSKFFKNEHAGDNVNSANQILLKLLFRSLAGDTSRYDAMLDSSYNVKIIRTAFYQKADECIKAQELLESPKVTAKRRDLANAVRPNEKYLDTVDKTKLLKLYERRTAILAPDKKAPTAGAASSASQADDQAFKDECLNLAGIKLSSFKPRVKNVDAAAQLLTELRSVLKKRKEGAPVKEVIQEKEKPKKLTINPQFAQAMAGLFGTRVQAGQDNKKTNANIKTNTALDDEDKRAVRNAEYYALTNRKR